MLVFDAEEMECWILSSMLELCHIDGSIFSLDWKRNTEVQFGSKPFGLFGVHFMTFSSDKLPFPINEPQNKVHQFSRSKHSTVRTVACKWTHPFSALRSASGGSFNVFEPLVYIIWIFLFFGVPASKSIVHFAVLRLGSCLHPEVERSLSLHLRCSPP